MIRLGVEGGNFLKDALASYFCVFCVLEGICWYVGCLTIGEGDILGVWWNGMKSRAPLPHGSSSQSIAL